MKNTFVRPNPNEGKNTFSSANAPTPRDVSRRPRRDASASLRLASVSTATMVLKTEKCSFSGLRVYPGHGMRLTKIDSTTFLFLNGKCKKMFNQKKKPAKIAWTAAYRKAHKKVRRDDGEHFRAFVTAERGGFRSTVTTFGEDEVGLGISRLGLEPYHLRCSRGLDG